LTFGAAAAKLNGATRTGPLEMHMDPYRRTPELSPEGTREILEEMASPPKDTPERRATFERMRLAAEVLERSNLPAGTLAKLKK
jgi:hypothetical protein